MSDNFAPPTIKKLDNAVAAQVASEEKMDKSLKVPTEKVTTDPTTIYKNGIDNFTKFLAGEIHSGSLEERIQFQMSFLDDLWLMLKLDEQSLKIVLDYFVVQIIENRHLYSDGTIAAPLYRVEPLRSAQEILKYKRFLLFITTFADHARDRQRFLQQFDVAKFGAMFGPEIKQKLSNYVYR